ncbi:hypothetical protein PINS_up012193 [Pythium insidiosum]|nr:hypothetical protein PINS_up012193 [Pythium insidiosum]
MGCHGQNGQKGDGKETSKLWYLGVILSIIGSVCTNLGVNLQKYSFMREAKRSVGLKRAYARQPLWVIGLLLVIGGSGLDFVALGFLPQSLATPVGGSTMVANVAFASLLLKEKFTRMDAAGTSLVLGGICIVAAFANKEGGCYTVEELVTLYTEPLFIMYIVLMTLSCIGIYLLVKRVEAILRRCGPSSPGYKRFRRIHPVIYPALSGIFGAQSVLFAKSAIELIKTTASGSNQFATFGTYAITLSMFTCVFLQIHWLAHGLQSFDAVFIVPVFQCFFISVSIFGGGVYFKEFSSMSALALGMFFFGAGVTLSGVFLLSQREMNKLSPTQRLRACAKAVVFIKRVQKARKMDYKWRQPLGPVDTVKPMDGPTAPLHANVKLSKASVVPIEGPRASLTKIEIKTKD